MSSPTSDLYLSPNQQDLLVAALTSNQSTLQPNKMASKVKENNRITNRTDTPGTASQPSAPGSGRLEISDESPYMDYPLDEEGDESFNFDAQGSLFDDLDAEDLGDDTPTDSYDHLHDKRKSMDGQDEDDEGGGKRREGDDKTAKKPGRKPLTSEPTTKRKAQNRAAQRAFRERKEKHLKDLETKVEDLEKQSEATNHENGLLKAQVERLQVELKEYRKRLSWISSNGGFKQQSSNPQPRNTINSSSDFQFQFPKFGDSTNNISFGNSNIPAPQQPTMRAGQRTSSLPSYQSSSPASSSTRQSVSNGVSNRQDSYSSSINNSPMTNLMASPPSYNNQQLANTNAVDTFSGLFSPSILEATKNPSNGYFGLDDNQNKTRNRGSVDHSFSSVPGLYSGSSVSNTESPGSSADSHNQISSIGTSPEPNFHSPFNRLQDFGLNTINEEQNLSSSTAQPWQADTNWDAFDPSSFNFLAQQNGGNFDPVLFGTYRETQDNILSQDFGSFFNDAYPLPDLGSPSHNYGDVTGQSNDSKKADAISKSNTAPSNEVYKPGEGPKLMTCNKIWDRLQSMEKFRNGEIDIDNLCSELRAKAKCSEGGAVVEEKHVNKILGL